MPNDNRFFEGVEFGYRDCADLLERIANNIPEHLPYQKNDLLRISNAMRSKIATVYLMNATGQGNA